MGAKGPRPRPVGEIARKSLPALAKSAKPRQVNMRVKSSSVLSNGLRVTVWEEVR